MQALPASLVVIGGGYVGLEQAQLWAHLGVGGTLEVGAVTRTATALSSVEPRR